MKTRKKPPVGRSLGLTVKVTRGVLTIQIGSKVNAFACINKEPPLCLDVVDEDAFLKEVADMMEKEAQYEGDSHLVRFFDEMCEKAINDGSIYVLTEEDEP